MVQGQEAGINQTQAAFRRCSRFLLSSRDHTLDGQGILPADSIGSGRLDDVQNHSHGHDSSSPSIGPQSLPFMQAIATEPALTSFHHVATARKTYL